MIILTVVCYSYLLKFKKTRNINAVAVDWGNEDLCIIALVVFPEDF